MAQNVYPANFTKGSLLIPESKIIAGILLQEPSPAEWKRQVVDENILQCRTTNSALSVAGFIRSRLKTVNEELWKLVHTGGREVTVQSLLAATIKYSPLLGDYIRDVYQEERKRFSGSLRPSSWEQFIEECHNRIPDLPVRSESTQAKLKQNAFRILAEAGLIDNTKDMNIRHLHIAPAVKSLLVRHNEQYVLSCLLSDREPF